MEQAKNGEGEGEGLKLGGPLPDLVLKNEEGEEVKVQNLAENKKGVVLFLVPKADTRTLQSLVFLMIYQRSVDCFDYYYRHLYLPRLFGFWGV